MSKLIFKGTSAKTGKPYWVINEAHCPNLLFAPGSIFRFALRTFRRVYAVRWEQGKGWFFEKHVCLWKLPSNDYPLITTSDLIEAGVCSTSKPKDLEV